MNTVAAYQWSYPRKVASYSLTRSRQHRERILAVLAFVSLIVAWDATLRLDERVSPARVRMTHAVEIESETQTAALVP